MYKVTNNRYVKFDKFENYITVGHFFSFFFRYLVHKIGIITYKKIKTRSNLPPHGDGFLAVAVTSLVVGERVGDCGQLGVHEPNVGLEGQHAQTPLELVANDGGVGRVLGGSHPADRQQRDESRWSVRPTEVDDLSGAYHHRAVLFRFI